MAAPPSRHVYVDDAVAWLQKGVLAGSSLVASIPDFSEFPGKTLEEWKGWFRAAARAVVAATPPEGVSVFYQTDIKVEGVWVDKAFLCHLAAEELGAALVWHKVVCRVRPGQATFGRPGYAHVVCFSRGVRPPIGASTPDVIPALGDKVWERGMGFDVCRMIGRFILEQTTTRCVVNPFCGLGSMLAAANALGLDAIGVERSAKRAARARELKADLAAERFVGAAGQSGQDIVSSGAVEG